MMKPTLVAAGAAVAVAALLSATAGGTNAGAATAPRARVTAVRTAAGAAACPVRHAWADAITAGGRVAWQDRLPTGPDEAGITVRPVAAGGEAVFAEENAVYAIRLRDGKRLWRRAFSAKIAALTGAVYGLWAGTPGTVVVLTGQVSSDARLTALRLATGAVKWSLTMPGGLLGSQALVAGRLLAIQRPDGDTEAVDLAAGRVRWSRPTGRSDGPAAVGSVIAVGSAGGGRATGYDARSGTLLWTARGLPAANNLTAADGLLLSQNNVEGGGATNRVTALNPRTGQVAWTFDPHQPVTLLGAGAAGIALATYVPRRRIYLVSPATGRVRWSVAAFALADEDVPGELVETSAVVIAPEASVSAPPTDDRVVARSAATGRVLWSAPLGVNGIAGLSLVRLPLASGQELALAMSTGSASRPDERLTVRRLGTGRVVAGTGLPDVVSAPLTVAGGTILAQPDSLTCVSGFYSVRTRRAGPRSRRPR